MRASDNSAQYSFPLVKSLAVAVPACQQVLVGIVEVVAEEALGAVLNKGVTNLNV
jgi:hypothetical protein